MSIFAHKKVLVLNKSWTPLKVISLKEAITKLTDTYKDGTPKARIIDATDFQSFTWNDWIALRPKDGEESMRSVNALLRIPEVIQYTKFDKVPFQNKVCYNRRNLFLRDAYTCQFCGKKKTMSDLSLDHVIPKCQGGKTDWCNIVVACVDCNGKKAGRTPKEAGMKLLKKPVRPKRNFFMEDIAVKSWQQFLDAAYMTVELENDIKTAT